MGTAMVASIDHGGHLKDPFDPRDHYYTPDPGTQPPKHVNLRQDEAQFTSEIYDQLRSNTCVANATAAAFWYEEKAGRQAESFGETGPSRLFIYWLARGAYKDKYFEITDPFDSGSFTRDAMKAIAKCGASSEADWPFNLDNINTRPPDEVFEKAAGHKINFFYRLDPDRPDQETHQLTLEQKDRVGATLLDNLRKCLAEQYPVVFGFWYRLLPSASFDQTQKPFVLRDVWSLPDKPFPRHIFTADLPDELKTRTPSGRIASAGGHTVLAIGYDDDRQQVLIQNSRGSTWGDSGTFWMPYSWITDYAATNDFWTIRPTPMAEAKRWEEVHQEILGA